MSASAEIWDANAHFGTVPFNDADYSLSALLELMDSHSIARAAVFSLRGVYYDFHDGNEETMTVTGDNPRLLPVATIDPRRHIGCIEEVSLRAQQGCRALRFFPDRQGWPVSSLALRAILEEAARCAMAVMFPAGVAGMPTQALEAARGLDLPLILVAANYPTMAEAIAVARARDNVYIETSRLVAPGGVDLVAEAIGHERLVFGSGAPDCYPGSALALIEHSRLSPDRKQAVLRDNLKRALRL